MPQYSVMASRGRPGTKRGVPTAMGTQSQQNPGPPTVGLNTDVRVSYRPVTSQGLSGMQTRPLGPGRQIADKSYWLKILRDKVTEITQEIQSMQEEIVKHNQDNASQNVMERRYEETIKDVRALEGKLADFNLALDKLRTNTDVTEIKDTHDQLKFDNERDRKQIVALFVESRKFAEDTAKMEAKIQAIHKQAADQMESLGPDFQERYETISRINLDYKKDIEQKEDHLANLDRRIEKARNELQSDDYKRHERGLHLQKRLDALRKEEAEIVEETQTNMSPEEMKDKLKKKLRNTNSEISSLKKLMKKAKAEVQQIEDKVDKVRRDIDQARVMKEKGKKYEKLYERDDQMTAFINDFPKSKKETLNEIKAKQTMIVALMNHISKGVAWEGSLKAGNTEDINKVKQELTFKEKQTELSQDTLARANADLKKRKNELKKIETLSEKIAVELRSLAEKQQQMIEEMQTFKDPKALQEEATKDKRDLTLKRESTRVEAEFMRQLVEVVSQPLARQASSLKGNSLHRNIGNLEKKLSAYAQSVFQQSEFISSRNRESQYETLLEKAMTVCEKINLLHVARLTA